MQLRQPVHVDLTSATVPVLELKAFYEFKTPREVFIGPFQQYKIFLEAPLSGLR
jgi:hypothetical protein